MPAKVSAKKSRRDVIAALRHPKVAVMLMLGFSSGLPFLLTGNTLGYWLRDEGTTLQAIGFLSWVGLAYSVKFLWAPMIDRVDAPIFGRFGRRRGWMIISQLLVAAVDRVGPLGRQLLQRSREVGHDHTVPLPEGTLGAVDLPALGLVAEDRLEDPVQERLLRVQGNPRPSELDHPGRWLSRVA